MADWLYIVVSVAIAAFVGGVTNHFAIKMLFHPRSPVMIGKWRVPFTPGLIPKRREDIAESLGNVVSDYLVTAEGLQDMVMRPEFRLQAEEKMGQLLNRWVSSSLTVKEAALRIWSEEEWEAVKGRSASALTAILQYGFRHAWHKYGWEQKPLKSLVPGWSEDNRQVWSEAAADVILDAVAEELLSSQGQRLLAKMAAGLADNAGGFLGTMAAIFLDEEKLVQKLTPTLVRALQGEEARAKVASAIRARMEIYGEKPVGEVLRSLAGSEPEAWIGEKLDELPLEAWMAKAEGVKLASLLEPWYGQAAAAVPSLANRMLRLIARVIPPAMKAVRLPQLVKEQVQKFPVERLEEVILSVSGKEFRAITWLGVLLGGMIGLIQSLLLLWVGR
ncbi:DUF445 family protein [Paenibacillus sp. FSL W8-0186]|uniref:DUF445 family protein n=1 Tax=Paenibacillus woosongensis TaxID=307580 RepID=A0A7X2YXJ1_9BACL|nr:DUF445 family protein [Paenibacillus woosongensis]MUG43786.1 DUF445 family protein [Paenibacillus woosongensis]GIP56990.1 UPF0754 membrane protein [Paenibacillus woosongensis]